MSIRGIVSGGQTGADRAALDVALELGVQCGGWCPLGRAAEDGTIPGRYPLRESFSADPAVRTAWNVYDSDATLVLSPAPLTGGTRLTTEVARRFGRPLLVVDPEPGSEEAIESWLRGLPGPVLLNVAGPRESGFPGSYARVRATLASVVGRMATAAPPPRRTLVTGGAGYLGRHLIHLAPPGREVHATHRRTPLAFDRAHRVELADTAAVRDLFERVEPELVIHTAYGVADGACDIVAATAAVARAAAGIGARFVHLSTDMVLDGESGPFTEDADPAPVHRYGRWKAEAEGIAIREHPCASVIRASLITSFDPPDPRTEWVLAGLRGEASVALFVDEIRTPIHVQDLARQIWEIARLDEEGGAGVWNLAAPESFSRYALGALIAAAHGMNAAPLLAAHSTEAAEPRPRDLRLLTGRADATLLTRPRPLSVAAADCLTFVNTFSATIQDR